MDSILMDNYIENEECKKIGIKPEKRRYKEISTPCIARFRVKHCDGHEAPFSDWNMVAVKKLSADGIAFNYYKLKLESGSLLELKIDFIRSRPAISCVAKVVRIEEASTNSMFRITTEFTEINANDRKTINSTVEAIYKREVKKRVFSVKKTKKTNQIKTAFKMKNGFKMKTALARMVPIRTVLLHGW